MTDGTKPGKVDGLALLREPFPAHQISKLPKPTKQQTEAVRQDFKKGIRCKVCGGWHHPDVVHLDYVGHAALTDRLLDCDPQWNWEPIAIADNGAPLLDENGGMWIKLTVCGVTRLGYGHSDGKRGGDAVKEVIGDALRNAAMRFGAALDLWHKGQLHADDAPEDDDDDGAKGAGNPNAGRRGQGNAGGASRDAFQSDGSPNKGYQPSAAASDLDQPAEATIQGAISLMENAVSEDDLKRKWRALNKHIQADKRVADAGARRKTQLAAQQHQPGEPIFDDQIPFDPRPADPYASP